MHNLKTKKGFSLIEMLIYIALLVLLSSVVITTVFSLIDTFQGVRVHRIVQEGVVSSMERMSRDIRDANSIVGTKSTLGTHPGRLTVSRDLEGGGTEEIEFYLSGSALRVKKDDVDIGPLTSPSISVDSLIFTEISHSTSTGVYIEITLTGTTSSATSTKALDLFVILRGSY